MPDCIIPAAGFSRRMGTWKPQLPWGECTIVEKVVMEAQHAGCRVIVVGGHRFRRLQSILKNYPDIVLLRAKDWKLGIGASLRCSLESVRTRRFFVTPADMPLIRSEDYVRLAAMDMARVIRPVYENKPGHPVLINASLISQIMNAPKDARFMNTISRNNPTLISWNHSGVIDDLDTIEAYKKALKFFES